ncbi:uncharacterized protein IL334_003219 [Kwoniella shivajii]|uniref:GATA-type domain-containing protein n=1 Tax=Kwoniella shivajii TaxID=564305 RepID=A0ABZ1CWY0_9TREE|nr:hypothetical protein IL334_003219 [Kwoniella shivajii]
MTHAPFAFINNINAMPSSSSFKAKRKRMSWSMDEEENTKHIRIRSPTQQNSYQLPELMTDHSNSASDDDQMMDQDMDNDMDNDNDCHMAMGHSGVNMHQDDTSDSHNRHNDNYVYSSGGSGGFGFGPGAEEDELEYEMEMSSNRFKSSLTPHPNPHHFSNHYQSSLSSHHQYTSNNMNFRSTSPLAAQAFSQSLPAPSSGLLQPAYNGPLPTNASEVEKARNSHGPGCKSIPKLILSDYPDSNTGRRSMWSVCGDCGACEMAQ